MPFKCGRAREGVQAHLAGRKGEFAMADLAKTTDMAVDPDILGRVGEDEVDRFIAHEGYMIVPAPCIAAQEPVPPESPEITPPRHGVGR